MIYNVWFLLLLGLGLRLILLVYGIWQDRTMAVKFTDVDYNVFHDAAEYITKGESPYQRATYRYSPVLALALQPNIWWTVHFGKILFILFDLLTGYFIFSILQSEQASQKSCLAAAGLWLFNPLSATVSVRGNAESVMSSLVLVCVKFLLDRHVLAAGLMFALSIHFKIYPVTYALAIYLFLGQDQGQQGNKISKGEGHCHKDWFTRLRETVVYLLPNRDRLVFASSAAMTLAMLTSLFYLEYGWDFLYETYLYHVTRKDIRHNFSVYFYMLYLQPKGGHSTLLGLLAFIPQVVLLVIFSVKYHKDIPLVFFLNTFAFVTFNKVCTSQYFFWYLSILPLLLGNLKMSWRKACFTLLLWFLGQGLWLLPAYYLEFEGRNTFMWIWLAGLVFFSINLYVMYVIIDCYHWLPWKLMGSGKQISHGDSSRTKQTQAKRSHKRHFHKREKVS